MGDTGPAIEDRPSERFHTPRWTVFILDAVMVMTVVLTIVGLVIVQRVGNAYREALQVAQDAAAVAAAAADPATGLTAELGDLTRSLTETVDQVRTLAGTAASTIGQLGEAAQTNLADSVDGTASVADRAADLIATIERFIPGSSESLAEELRTIADGLEPVPDQLRSLGNELVTASEELTGSQASLEQLGTQVDSIADSIDETTEALADLPTIAQALEQRAQNAEDRAALDIWLFRLAVILGGAVVFLLALALRRMLPALAELSQ